MSLTTIVELLLEEILPAASLQPVAQWHLVARSQQRVTTSLTSHCHGAMESLLRAKPKSCLQSWAMAVLSSRSSLFLSSSLTICCRVHCQSAQILLRVRVHVSDLVLCTPGICWGGGTGICLASCHILLDTIFYPCWLCLDISNFLPFTRRRTSKSAVLNHKTQYILDLPSESTETVTEFIWRATLLSDAYWAIAGSPVESPNFHQTTVQSFCAISSIRNLDKTSFAIRSQFLIGWLGFLTLSP